MSGYAKVFYEANHKSFLIRDDQLVKNVKSSLVQSKQF